MKSAFLLVGASALALCTTSAIAQETVSLSAGFAPDRVTYRVLPGQERQASWLDDYCVGTIAGRPDVVLNFQSNGGPLSFGVIADSGTVDTTLVIEAPDGRYFCNDDINGLNPRVRWRSAPSGQYKVWVGAVGPSGQSTLIITEGSVFGD